MVSSAQIQHEEVEKKYIYTPNHRDGNFDSINHRNLWTQFGYGFMQGMLKFSKLDGPISCVSEGGQLWTAWSTLAIEWASA